MKAAEAVARTVPAEVVAAVKRARAAYAAEMGVAAPLTWRRYPSVRIGLWAGEPAVLNATVVGRPSWHRWSWWVNFDGGTLREGKATTLKAACRAAEAVAAEIPAEVVARLRFLANLPSADLDAACAGRASTLEPGA